MRRKSYFISKRSLLKDILWANPHATFWNLVEKKTDLVSLSRDLHFFAVGEKGKPDTPGSSNLFYFFFQTVHLNLHSFMC